MLNPEALFSKRELKDLEKIGKTNINLKKVSQPCSSRIELATTNPSGNQYRHRSKHQRKQKLSFRWKTNYGQSFEVPKQAQKITQPSTVNRNIPFIQSQKITSTPLLQKKSEYLSSFTQKVGQAIKRKKSEGISQDRYAPFQTITTYKNNFIGHRGANQYVKPTNKVIRKSVKFVGETTYQHLFIQNKGQEPAQTLKQAQRSNSLKEKSLIMSINKLASRTSYERDFGWEKPLENSMSKQEKQLIKVNRNLYASKNDSPLIHEVGSNEKFIHSEYQNEFIVRNNEEKTKCKISFLKQMNRHGNRLQTSIY